MNKSVTGAPASFQYMFGPWAVVPRRQPDGTEDHREVRRVLSFVAKRLAMLVVHAARRELRDLRGALPGAG